MKISKIGLASLVLISFLGFTDTPEKKAVSQPTVYSTPFGSVTFNKNREGYDSALVGDYNGDGAQDIAILTKGYSLDENPNPFCIVTSYVIWGNILGKNAEKNENPL